MFRIKNLVAGHDRDQVFRLAQIDDIMGPAGDHVDSLDLLAADLKFHSLARADIPLLNEPMALDHNEKLPFGVMPVLTLGDARPGDIDADLAAILRVEKLGEGASVIHIHLEGIFEFFLGEVAEIEGIELFSKAALGHFGHHEAFGLGLELLQKADDLAQGDPVRDGNAAIAAFCPEDRIHAFKLAAALLALQQVKHALHQVVDIKELQLHRGVVHMIGLIVGHGPAEGGNGGVIVRAGMAHEIGETIDCHLGAGLLAVGEEELLPCLFAPSVFGIAETPGQSGLNGRGKHEGGLVLMLFQSVQKVRGKAEVALHEVLRLLRTVDSRQVEDEIAVCAEAVQLLRRIVKIVLVDLLDPEIGTGAIFVVPDIFQIIAEGGSHHALCAGD